MALIYTPYGSESSTDSIPYKISPSGDRTSNLPCTWRSAYSTKRSWSARVVWRLVAKAVVPILRGFDSTLLVGSVLLGYVQVIESAGH